MDSSTLFVVQEGKDFTLEEVGINKHAPKTDNFIIFEFRALDTKRFQRILICTHCRCMKTFRKWHNFFDHLRIHTKERPYVCSA